jgi:acyl-CoA synthetase (AMP-forming)/AMP-acid ligase II
MDIGSLLDIAKDRFPDKPAIISEGNRYTYRQFKDRIQRLMGGLFVLGVKKGDRVAALMWNSSEMMEVYLAAIRLGAIFTPLNYRLKEPELCHLLKDATPKVLVADEQCQQLAGQATACVDNLQHLFSTTSKPADGFKRYEDFISAHEPLDKKASIKADDPCQLLYTSGTTGRPKGVVLSHENISWNTFNMIHVRRDRSRDVSLLLGPLFHAAALNSHFTARLALGATQIFMKKFDPERLMEAIQRERVTVLPANPTAFIMLMEHCSPGRYNTTSVTTLSSGSDKLPDQVKQNLLDYFPQAKGVYDIYGITECGPCISCLSAEDSMVKTACVGFPLPFVQVRLVDEKDNQVPPGHTGEVLVKGPNVMKEYYGKPAQTAKVFKNDWFYTGDLARFDDEGYLYIVDRKKDIIISGGENVSAREVEEALFTHSAIFRAAVFGTPHPKWGEQVTAAVVLAKGHDISSEQLITYLRAGLAGYKIPRKIHFLESLPESGPGKINKKRLKEVLASHNAK